MTFNEYQDEAKKTAMYPNVGNNITYPILGLNSEVGEISGKAKKVFRDNGGVLDEVRKKEMMKELSDVLWYCAMTAYELGYRLDDVAQFNVDKLKSRMERGTIQGSGDNR